MICKYLKVKHWKGYLLISVEIFSVNVQLELSFVSVENHAGFEYLKAFNQG